MKTIFIKIKTGNKVHLSASDMLEFVRNCKKRTKQIKVKHMLDKIFKKYLCV